MFTNPQGHSLFTLYGLFPLIKAGICFLTTAKEEKKKWEVKKGSFPASFYRNTILLEKHSNWK